MVMNYEVFREQCSSDFSDTTRIIQIIHLLPDIIFLSLHIHRSVGYSFDLDLLYFASTLG